MKSANIFFDRSYGYAKAIVALLVGLVLVIWPDFIKKYIIFILGALILAIGVAAIILSYTGKWKHEKVPLLLLNSIVDIVFGIVLLIFPNFFAKLIMFVFGIVLLVFGLGEIINLARTQKLINIQWWLYIGPGITTVLGIILFFFPNQSGNVLFIIFGITTLIYAVSEFISTYIIRSKMKKYEEEEKKEKVSEIISDDNIVKDVPYEEIKDEK